MDNKNIISQMQQHKQILLKLIKDAEVSVGRFDRAISELTDAFATWSKDQFLPPLAMLERSAKLTPRNLMERSEFLQETLSELRILHKLGTPVGSGDVTCGPTTTLFEFRIHPDIRWEELTARVDKLAAAILAENVQVIVTQSKDTVAIEVPNYALTPARLGDLLESDEWQTQRVALPVLIGRDSQGLPVVGNLAQMPHLLIAGDNNAENVMCLKGILMSLLYRSTAEDVRLLLMDPKQTELESYNGLPHLLAPVIVDPNKAVVALGWLVTELERRFSVFAKEGVRNIQGFNARGADKLPSILAVVTGLETLMAEASAGIEMSIARLTALGRAAGIHLIVATRTPDVTVLTGVIKANIPARIAFRVASEQESRLILDEDGAEKLRAGQLLSNLGTGQTVRAQAVLVRDEEIKQTVDFVCTRTTPQFDEELCLKLT